MTILAESPKIPPLSLLLELVDSEKSVRIFLGLESIYYSLTLRPSPGS